MRKWVYVFFAILCVFSIILFCIFNFFLYPKKFSNYITYYSNEYGVDRALVYAIIKTESDFDSKAVSSAGAMGLMQIMPRTGEALAKMLGEEFNQEMLYDPETNIRYGTYYLKYLFEKFESIDIVICAYNAGEGVVKNWIDENGKLVVEKINYSETKNYYFKVKRLFNVYSSSSYFE